MIILIKLLERANLIAKKIKNHTNFMNWVVEEREREKGETEPNLLGTKLIMRDSSEGASSTMGFVYKCSKVLLRHLRCWSWS
jgi:hypothetical protein